MRFDLSTTIPALLALAGGSGALAGCLGTSCPDASEFHGSVSVHNANQEAVKAALSDLVTGLCDEACASQPTGSVCTPSAGENPIDSIAYCDVALPDGTTSATFIDAPGYNDALMSGIGDCESLCNAAHEEAYPDDRHTPYDSCSVEGSVPDDYDVVCVFVADCGAGRAPRGLIKESRGPVAATDRVAEYWASMAYLERASVLAFEELAEDLARHGAPSDLVDRALAAAGDEREHARVCARFAEARGARLPSPRVAEVPSRSLLDIALHNARHGCVMESFAALEALYQAANAEDPGAREALTRIGHDETRHGQLAWDIDAWVRTALDPALHALLDRERALAVEDLAIEAPRACDPRLAAVGRGRPAPIALLARAFGEQALSAA